MEVTFVCWTVSCCIIGYGLGAIRSAFSIEGPKSLLVMIFPVFLSILLVLFGMWFDGYVIFCIR